MGRNVYIFDLAVRTNCVLVLASIMNPIYQLLESNNSIVTENISEPMLISLESSTVKTLNVRFQKSERNFGLLMQSFRFFLPTSQKDKNSWRENRTF